MCSGFDQRKPSTSLWFYLCKKTKEFMTELIEKYFEINTIQKQQFGELQKLYSFWNEKINLISRKDIENLMLKHVLHSLGIAKFYSFEPDEKIIDIGTGGGFPGIPLAILFPQTQFDLVDSIGKKVNVAAQIAQSLSLSNVRTFHARAETLPAQYDFAVSRAVAQISELYEWTKKVLKKKKDGELKSGLICLKGGDLRQEFSEFKHHFRFNELAEAFEEDFFTEKKVVYVPF
jgi:16S rRNA (guanine527-N7)-methyltransferase